MNIQRCIILLLLLATSSFAAEGTALTATGDQISYMKYGNGRPALILIHGWANNQTFWEQQIPGLSNDHQVVTLDLAGFGTSAYERDDWSMRGFALDVDAVLIDLGIDEAVLVGFSMGGTVALELASLGRPYVKGVVLVDTLRDPQYRPELERIEQVVEYNRSMWGKEEFFASFLSDGAPEALVQRLMSSAPEAVPDVWWESLRQVILWNRERFLDTVALIDVPIVAINSAQRPTNIDAWSRIAPGFRVHVIDGVGHLGVIWKKVEEFNRALLEHISQIDR